MNSMNCWSRCSGGSIHQPDNGQLRMKSGAGTRTGGITGALHEGVSQPQTPLEGQISLLGSSPESGDRFGEKRGQDFHLSLRGSLSRRSLSGEWGIPNQTRPHFLSTGETMTHIQKITLEALKNDPTFDGDMKAARKRVAKMSDREIAEGYLICPCCIAAGKSKERRERSSSLTGQWNLLKTLATGHNGWCSASEST
jgi:hypothetical protein